MSKKSKGKEILVWAVKMVKVKDLIRTETNPRTITKERLARLQSKIERLGFNTPVKLDNDGKVIGGDKRFVMLSEGGYGELEIPAMIPPRKLTEKEKQEIIIADNVHEGEWDWEMLGNYFDPKDLKTWGLDEVPQVVFDDEEEDEPKELKTCPHCGEEI